MWIVDQTAISTGRGPRHKHTICAMIMTVSNIGEHLDTSSHSEQTVPGQPVVRKASQAIELNTTAVQCEYFTGDTPQRIRQPWLL